VEFIIGAILEPQKEIKEGYTSIAVTTKDGEEYQGYALRETGDELVLRDVLQNREVRLRPDVIQENIARQKDSVVLTESRRNAPPAPDLDAIRAPAQPKSL